MATLDDFEDRLIRHGVLPVFEETQRANINLGDAAKIGAALDALEDFVEAERDRLGWTETADCGT